MLILTCLQSFFGEKQKCSWSSPRQNASANQIAKPVCSETIQNKLDRSIDRWDVDVFTVFLQCQVNSGFCLSTVCELELETRNE